MKNQQLYFAIGLPLLINGGFLGILLLYMSAKFGGIDKRFEAIDKRFDDIRDLWRAELRRVEEILDARLKHLEEH